MSDNAESNGFFQVLFGDDSLKKANIYRVVGLFLTVFSAFATLGTALILKSVPLPVFIGLGAGAFCTFVSLEMRRRLVIEGNFQTLRDEIAAIKQRLE